MCRGSGHTQQTGEGRARPAPGTLGWENEPQQSLLLRCNRLVKLRRAGALVRLQHNVVYLTERPCARLPRMHLGPRSCSHLTAQPVGLRLFPVNGVEGERVLSVLWASTAGMAG